MAENIHVKLPDGSVKEVPRGTTALEIAKGISPRLADAALAAQMKPLSSNGGGNGSKAPAETTGAAAAHCRAKAERRQAGRSRASPRRGRRAAHPDRARSRIARSLPPLVRAPDGRSGARTVSRDQARPRPATESGFFYDFYREKPFTPEDLEEIEKKMQELVQADLPYAREFLPRDRRPGEVQGRRRLHEVPFHRAVHPAR